MWISLCLKLPGKWPWQKLVYDCVSMLEVWLWSNCGLTIDYYSNFFSFRQEKHIPSRINSTQLATFYVFTVCANSIKPFFVYSTLSRWAVSLRRHREAMAMGPMGMSPSDPCQSGLLNGSQACSEAADNLLRAKLPLFYAKKQKSF